MPTIECYLLEQFHQLALPDDYYERLPENQRLRASTLTGKRLQEFYFGRQLLKFACQQSIGGDKTEIIERENDAPWLNDHNGKPIANSITHSPHWLGVIVCGDTDVDNIGIDIETIRDNWTVEKAALFCNQAQIEESLTIQDTALRNRFYTRLWTQKEAHFKAGGEHIFNTSNILKEESLTHTEYLDQHSVMSIYCPETAVININNVSLIDNKLTIS